MPFKGNLLTTFDSQPSTDNPARPTTPSTGHLHESGTDSPILGPQTADFGDFPAVRCAECFCLACRQPSCRLSSPLLHPRRAAPLHVAGLASSHSISKPLHFISQERALETSHAYPLSSSQSHINTQSQPIHCLIASCFSARLAIQRGRLPYILHAKKTKKRRSHTRHCLNRTRRPTSLGHRHWANIPA